MMYRDLLNRSALAGTLVLSLSASAGPALSGSPAVAREIVIFEPLQSISRDFGSKFMSGYFIQQAGQCVLTMMIIEKSDPEAPLPATAARVRLVLHPHQVAGLDSEEGRSLNLTCGNDARTVRVQAGARNALTAVQMRTLETQFAKARPQ